MLSRVAAQSLGRLLVGCAAAVLVGGSLSCGEPFDPYWRLDGYRVLGIKSDPVTLEPGGAAEVSVLDHVPAGESVTYEWSWCPVAPSAQERFDCPLDDLAGQTPDADSPDAGAAPDVGTAPDAGSPDAGAPPPDVPVDSELLELGDGETALLPYPGTADQVLEICRRIQRAVAEARESSNLDGSLPTSNCERGYDISVRLEATTESGTVEVAKKEFTLSTGGDQQNANPDHGGLEVRVAEPADIPKARERLDWVPPAEQDRDEHWVAAPADQPLDLLGGMSFEIRALVDAESAEEYRPPPPVGSDRERMPPERENLSFRWFTSRGDLDETQRVYVPDRENLEPSRTTALTVGAEAGRSCAGSDAGERDGECRAAVYSVVRDGRLGLDYARAEFRLVGGVEE